MNVPTLPSDSLYKFAALAGLVLILSGIYFSYFIIERAHDRALKLRLEVEKSTVELKFLKIKQDRIESIIKSATDGSSPQSVIKQGKMPIEISSGEYKRMVAETEQLAHDEAVKFAQQKVRLEELETSFQRMLLYQRGLTLLGIIGTIISVYGFVLWCRRVQQLQDTLLRNQTRAEFKHDR